VFLSEQLGKSLPKGTVVSVGGREGPVGEIVPRPNAWPVSVVSFVGEAPRLGPHPRTTCSLVKTACDYSYTLRTGPS